MDRLFYLILYIIISITFRTDAKTIISDTVEYTQSTLICFLNDLSELFDELMRMSENQMNIAFILKCSNSLKIQSEKVGKAFSELFSKQTYLFFNMTFLPLFKENLI